MYLVHVISTCSRPFKKTIPVKLKKKTQKLNFKIWSFLKFQRIDWSWSKLQNTSKSNRNTTLLLFLKTKRNGGDIWIQKPLMEKHINVFASFQIKTLRNYQPTTWNNNSNLKNLLFISRIMHQFFLKILEKCLIWRLFWTLSNCLS